MHPESNRVRAEAPKRRKNPDGKTVWIARYTKPDCTRAIWKPDWNRGKGTFTRQVDAQRAIAEAYQWHESHRGADVPLTIGDYFETWTSRHPRADRTNRTNEHRISRVLEVEIDGRPLRNWPYSELHRRHAHALVDRMLREQGRSVSGVRNILRPERHV